MSELSMSMFANSVDYWKARCANAEDQLIALKEENERLIKECNTWVNQYDCARVENEAAIVKINELSQVLWKLINCGALSEEAKFTSIDGSMKILSDVLGEI